MNRIRGRLEITDTGEDVEAVPCLFSLEVDGQPILLLGESARALGIPSHDASYSLYALFDGVQGLLLTLVMDHHAVTDPTDPYASPLFVADCGVDCCGYHDLTVVHRQGRVYLEDPGGGGRYVVELGEYARAVLSAVQGFLDFATRDTRLRDDEAWHLYDHLSWIVRKLASDATPPVREACRQFLDRAEEQIQRATRPAQGVVRGTH